MARIEALDERSAFMPMPLTEPAPVPNAEVLLERRVHEQAALYRFTDRLYRATSDDDVHRAALDAIVDALGCDRASVLLFDSLGVMRFVAARGLSENYCAAVNGHSPWRPTDVDPAPIFIDDIMSSAESEALKHTVKAEGITALAFIPLVSEGAVVGKFMTYHNHAHRYTDAERDLAVTIARQLGFALAKRRSDSQRDLLVAELSHRVKNTLATVLSIARQSFAKDMPVDAARRSFEGRLRALAQTHTRLAEASWDGVLLATLVEDELAPYRIDDGAKVEIEGPPVIFTPRQAVVVGMALHELAANAAKYGALTRKRGRVAVRWAQPKDGPFAIEWRETGGPAVTAPKRSGFGRLLLERALAADLRGTVALDFSAEGLVCRITLPLEAAPDARPAR